TLQHVAADDPNLALHPPLGLGSVGGGQPDREVVVAGERDRLGVQRGGLPAADVAAHDRLGPVVDDHRGHPVDMPVIDSRSHPCNGHGSGPRSVVDWSLCLTRSGVGAELRVITLGHPLLDDYLAFVGARARPNTWLATAYDLKVFFTVVAKEPAQVTTADVFAFIKAQRSPRGDPKVVRLEDGGSGLAARTIKRRLASVSGLFAYL